MNIQLAILQNQHSGKDTHIRQVKIFGPREYKWFSCIKMTEKQLQESASLILRALMLFNTTISDKQNETNY